MVGRKLARRLPRKRPVSPFRPSAPAGPTHAPSRVQLIALLTGVLLVAAGIAVASFVVKPSKARSFDLVYGSMFIDDNTSPVAVDLASGKPTVRLRNAFTAVSAKSTGDLDVVALDGGNTLMLNPATGEFNLVDSTGFVVKPTDGGVQLPKADDATRSLAVPSGDSAYILRSGTSGTAVYLVGHPTVSSAIGRNAKAKARAYATLSQPLPDEPAAAASADGDLWMATGPADATSHAITQLSVPAGSNAGVTLREQHHGSVSGTVAIGSATRNADGTGGDAVGVATATSLQVFAGGSSRRLTVAASGPVDQILAASNAQGRLVFLYHSSSGWSEVSAPVSAVGSGGGRATRTQLDGIAAAAQLVTPAESDGRLYTMDTSGDGNLWQINAAAKAQVIAGAPHYPVRTGERLDLTTSEVVARGNRVIFNARANYEAEVVFSDGSHDPRTIDKHSAVQVDPSGATALADAHTKGNTKPDKTSTKPTKTPRPTQAINDKIDCKTTTQIPHIPTLIPGERGARSIALTWVYPTLDNSDCAVSTFVVSVKVLSSGAPSPPAKLTVQGQNGVTLTHLFPATQYKITLTAYLNGRGTSSAPVLVTTGPEGPAAPTSVSAATTSTGNWTVAWTSCGGVAQGCVPATTWYVIPSFCDGRGLSNVPDRLTVAEDPTVHSFTVTYPGSDALLGRGLCFQLQGVGPQGTVGTASAPTAAAYSYSPPIAGALKLSASQPPTTSFGGSATTSVDLDLGENAVRDVGGLGATITFTLNGPGGAKTKSVTYDGRSTRASTSFPGIQAGAQYTAQATVSAPRHSTLTASTAVVTVTTRANWPSLTATANCPPNGAAIVLTCTLGVRIGSISSAAAGGEQFTLTDASNVVCGSTGFSLDKANFDPARQAITQTVDLLQYSGSCRVSVALVEGSGARDPAVFGGTASPVVSTTVDLGRASTLDAGQSSFAGAWTDHDGSSALLRYTGSRTDSQVSQVATAWSELLLAPNGTQCGGSNAQPTHEGIYLDVSGNCVNDFGAQPGWQVKVTYADRSRGGVHGFSFTLDGTPPSYVPPCVISASNFAANWGGTADLPAVAVDFTASGSDLRGCSDWSYTLQKNLTEDCGSANGNPAPNAGQIAISATCDTTTLGLTWRVEITYTSARHDAHPVDVDVQGDPPQPPTTPPPSGPPPSGPPPSGPPS